MLKRAALPAPPATLSMPELVATIAALIALNAISIDIMLPALPDIARSFALTNPNDAQLVVSSYLLALGLAQLIYGPLSDALGRRSVLTWSLGLYAAATALCVVAPNFWLFLLARSAQGFGAAAMRVVAVAVVRDQMEGRRMAQVMSMAMSVFMIVPIAAPIAGQFIVLAGPWRWIFGVLLIYVIILLGWLMIRLPETLPVERRQPLNLATAFSLYWRVLSNRQTFGYMLAGVLSTGFLFAYVVSSQQIFGEYYQLGAAFPLAFAGVALVLTAASFANAKIVTMFGLRKISMFMTIWMTTLCAINAVSVYFGMHSFWLFMVLFSLAFAVFNMVSANFNALAMQPAGFAAGSAAAIYGAASSVGGAVLGALIGHAYNGTPLPFLIGLTVLGVLILAVILWTERGNPQLVED